MCKLCSGELEEERLKEKRIDFEKDFKLAYSDIREEIYFLRRDEVYYDYESAYWDPVKRYKELSYSDEDDDPKLIVFPLYSSKKYYDKNLYNEMIFIRDDYKNMRYIPIADDIDESDDD